MTTQRVGRWIAGAVVLALVVAALWLLGDIAARDACRVSERCEASR